MKMSMMDTTNLKVKEIECKSLLNESKLADYCINCYVGCEHGCCYCYADSITKRFSRHSERWGRFVDVKVNAPEILSKEIKRKKRGRVFLSSLCDPYMPLEAKYKLTRRCLELLLAHQFPITIQTKSALVLRDLDLLKQFKERGVGVEVGFTFTTLNDAVRKVFEPNSSSIKEKLDAVKTLKENGIRVYVFFGPILPYLSYKSDKNGDKDLEEYFETFKNLEVDEILIDRLNMKPGLWQSLEPVLAKNYPEIVGKWREILFSQTDKIDYWANLKERIGKICAEKKMKCVFCY